MSPTWSKANAEEDLILASDILLLKIISISVPIQYWEVSFDFVSISVIK